MRFVSVMSVSKLALAVVLCALSGVCHATIELLVPAYFYPSTSGSEWNTLIAAAQDSNNDKRTIVFATPRFGALD